MLRCCVVPLEKQSKISIILIVKQLMFQLVRQLWDRSVSSNPAGIQIFFANFFIKTLKIQIDDLEEVEKRLKDIDANPKHRWRNLDDAAYGNFSENFPSKNFLGTLLKEQAADRKTFYFIWLSIIALALGFVYFKYRQNKSRFWKTFYYYNDYKL